MPTYAKIMYLLLLTLVASYLIAAFINPNIILKTWKVIKERFNKINSVRGWITAGLIWTALSGAGVLVIGFVLRNHAVMSIASTIIIFWAGPATPLIPIVLSLTLGIEKAREKIRKESERK